jgi:hypothetical protein
MGSSSFERLKAALLEEYIQFCIVTPDNVTKEIMAEKLCDYFEKFQYKSGKKFEDLVKSYMTELDSLVEPRVAQTPAAKKSEPVPVVPRARRYYEKAAEIKKSLKNISELIDYSRLMLCLYAAIINSGDEKITNFDFSLTCLEPNAIEAALKNEKGTAWLGKKNPKPRFDTSDPYTTDRSFFVLLILQMYAIIGDSNEEGLENE